MKRIFLLLIVIITLYSCKKNDNLSVDDSINKSEQTPVYNFDVQDVTGKDSIPLNKTVSYQVYLKQQNFYQSGQIYTISWSPSDQQLDGTISYNNKEYRQGDLLGIEYDNIKSTNVCYVTYKAFSARKGTYTLDFTVTDRKGITYTKSKNLKVY